MNTGTVDLTVLDSSDAFWESPRQTAPQMLVLAQDPIAAACSVYRRWRTEPGNQRWMDLQQAEVTQEDLAQAQQIRKYYADRLIVSMLTNRTISEFRKKLYGVVSDSLPLQIKDIGLLYRLPYFYVEDLALDRVFDHTNPATEHLTGRLTAEFTVLEKILRSRKSGDHTQYWMTSNHSSAAYMLTIGNDNPYCRLITQILTQPVKLTANLHIKYHRGHQHGRGFYVLNDIEVAQ